jgi:hypothetical protein
MDWMADVIHATARRSILMTKYHLQVLLVVLSASPAAAQVDTPAVFIQPAAGVFQDSVLSVRISWCLTLLELPRHRAPSA